MKKILSLRDVSLSYHSPEGETPALYHISFCIYEGEFITIVGPSGCGKSTLLSILSGLLAPEEGTISFENPSGSISYPKIGYMLQKDHLFEWRTIMKNVTLGLELKHQLTEENIHKVEEMLRTYDLYKFKDARPSQLSGGMRQRAALIRTLALEPDILLLDEPFSALDYQTRLNVSDDIYNIIKNEGKTAIMVTHDLSEAISLGERIFVLSRRPGTVKKEITVKLSCEKRSPITSRNAPEFKDYFNMLWKELN